VTVAENVPENKPQPSGEPEAEVVETSDDDEKFESLESASELKKSSDNTLKEELRGIGVSTRSIVKSLGLIIRTRAPRFIRFLIGINLVALGNWLFVTPSSHNGLIFLGITLVAAGFPLAIMPSGRRDKHRELDARSRLYQAERELARSVSLISLTSDGQKKDLDVDRLALPALWDVTHSRLDLYHQIATDQARRSFITAQVAIAAGFGLLVGFAVVAALTHSIPSAITASALGAISAGLAGYISRTFVRSQELTAGHLHAYFDEPLKFARYLAAERLLASAKLSDTARAEILKTIIEATVDRSPVSNTGSPTG